MAAAPQNPNQAIDMMTPITTVHLILMAALAFAAIVTIWWGSVLYRRRKQAARLVREHYEMAEAHGATTEPVTTLADVGSATVPVAVPDAPITGADPALAADLTQIKGLGPKLAATLAEHGITRVEQIAALTPGEAANLDARLGTFQGRMARDRWIEQARLLSAGDRAGYEAAFGKLGG